MSDPRRPRAAGLLALAVSCDLPPPAPSSGAPTVLGVEPVPDERGFSSLRFGESLRFRFSVPLAPWTIHRAAVVARSGGLSLIPRLRYDPAASEVAVRLDPSDVQPGLEYVMSVLPAITSWDGIPLAEGRSFRVRFTDVPAGPPSEAPAFSRDVLPRLQRSCGLDGCHAASGAALGLDLSSGDGVRRTAIGVIASAWPTVAGDIDRGNIQWSGLHRIAPGAPGESYLLYKILGVGPVRGARMPRGSAPWTRDDARVVSDWIAAGALTR